MDDQIKQASDALRAGNKDEARRLLTLAIRQDPNNERAWGWMYNAANTDEERVKCLHEMVRINSSNDKAKQLLSQFNNFDPPLEMPNRSYNTPSATEKLNDAGQRMKKTGGLMTLFISVPICICLVAILFANLGGGGISSQIVVKYKLSGNAQSALVTYENAQGGTEQSTVNVPFEKDMTVSLGSMLSLVAQNQGSGSLTCEIWVGDKQTKSSTSTNEYGVVTCSDLAK